MNALPSLMKKSWTRVLLMAGALAVSGCGGSEPRETAQPAGEASERTVHAMSTCRDMGYCVVRSSIVDCHSGPDAYAWKDSEGTWCIEQDACNGNPTICPYY